MAIPNTHAAARFVFYHAFNMAEEISTERAEQNSPDLKRGSHSYDVEWLQDLRQLSVDFLDPNVESWTGTLVVIDSDK